MDTNDRDAICEEMRRSRVTFRRLVEDASRDDLARRTNGTRWTNRQLLFHMLLGYLIMPPLFVVAGMFARLPTRPSLVFARLLDATTGPFNWINYLGSCAGAAILAPSRMAARLDRVTLAMERRLRGQTGVQLRRGMHYPVRWDPFFKDFMTVADLYHYPTQHFDFHERQLTLGLRS